MTKEITAYQKYIRQTPQKLRLVADMIRNLSVDQALIQLKVSSKNGAKAVEKVLTQARANAIDNGFRSDTLKIKSIQIEEGATYKRWQPVSRGRAHSILKRTSHIRIVLEGSDIEASKPTPKTANKSKTDTKKGK